MCTVYVLLYCTPAHNAAVGPPRPPSSARGFGCYCTHLSHRHSVAHHARTRAEPFPHPRCHGLAVAAALAAMDDGPISWRPEAKIHQVSNASWIAVMGTLLFRATQVPNGQMAVSFFFPIVGSFLDVSFRLVRFGCCCCVCCLLRKQNLLKLHKFKLCIYSSRFEK